LIKAEVYTSDECIQGSYSEDYEGKILVLPTQSFHPVYREAKYQLFRATGGFGCSPDTLGTAVFGHFIYDGEECRYRRGDFVGVLKPELVAELDEDDFPFLNKE
jgi:hypothetical protein